MKTTDNSRADALTEAVTHTIDTIGRQLDLIAERAPGNILDKVPVVRSLTAHKRRLEKALATVEQHDAAPAGDVARNVEHTTPQVEALQRAIKNAYIKPEHEEIGREYFGLGFMAGARAVTDAPSIAQPAPSAPLEGTGNGADERALYERLHTLMPEWYPDAWDDLPPKYRDAYATAALSRAPRTEVAGAVPRLDDADIDVIAESMPGGLGSFMKQWGWRQFARAVEDEVRLLIPSADAAAAPADGLTPVVGPVSVHRTHPNQAYVTLGFGSEELCSAFLKALNKLYARAAAPQPAAAAGQEAVAYTHPDRLGRLASGKVQCETLWSKDLLDDGDIPLYTAPPAQVATRDPISIRGIEGALADLIDSIVPGLDSGDILADAKAALSALATRQGLTDEQIINQFYIHTVMDDEPLFAFDRRSALELARALLEGAKQ